MDWSLEIVLTGFGVRLRDWYRIPAVASPPAFRTPGGVLGN